MGNQNVQRRNILDGTKYKSHHSHQPQMYSTFVVIAWMNDSIVPGEMNLFLRSYLVLIEVALCMLPF